MVESWMPERLRVLREDNLVRYIISYSIMEYSQMIRECTLALGLIANQRGDTQ
jgi:hypothetical protein